MMNKLNFTKDGKSAYEKILSVWPAIIRGRREEKLATFLSLLMMQKKIKKADQQLVIEAARFVFPKSYDPIFHMIEDMDNFVKQMLDPFKDMKAYNKMPVKVKRWKKANRQKKQSNKKQKK